MGKSHHDNSYHAAVDTSNGVEAQNKLLKYKYIPRRRSLTLSAIVVLIIEIFLPEMHSKLVHVSNLFHVSRLPVLQ